MRGGAGGAGGAGWTLLSAFDADCEFRSGPAVGGSEYVSAFGQHLGNLPNWRGCAEKGIAGGVFMSCFTKSLLFD